MSRKQELQKEIDQQLDEYQRMKNWVQEANDYYARRYFLPGVKIQFREADYHEAHRFGMTPEQFVLSAIQEKESELEYEWEYQTQEPCEICGRRDCQGYCDEDFYRCYNCGSVFCTGRCIQEDYDYMR